MVPRRRRSWAEDHPRSRGVYSPPGDPGRCRRGSSPLARGLHNGALGQGVEVRIIPARAGFTSPTSSSPTLPQDHPRSRGVYRHVGDGARRRLGIIPARAGFTSPSGRKRRPEADHPRSRGVYTTSLYVESQRTGSSPLARGLRPETMSPTTARSGSSPLARGLRHVVPQVRSVVGIIPARAGFTADERNRMSGLTDHPRSRGVYDIVWFNSNAERGSSPLARGLRLRGSRCR